MSVKCWYRGENDSLGIDSDAGVLVYICCCSLLTDVFG